MKVSMIAAMADNRVIGLNNKMPWHMPIDLKHFKQITLGKPVVMGRKTFESIGRPLPGRRNVIISRQTPADTKGADWVSSLEQAFSLLSAAEEVMIIGGGQIYQQALPFANRLYLTQIDLKTQGDAFFPDYQAESAWDIISQEEFIADQNNPYNCCFITLERQ
ncbi:type 3 dihydrofolate reductase [Rheinheimera sp. WS51]|uniref:type 3 dihydrofolate reductase n=1 Tax=Rheinheimera sp. WS51 TaxID=3425886 RepID=UPI003D904BD7